MSNEDFTKLVNKKGDGKMRKFWVIGLTLLFLLIPLAFLSSIISDREIYREEAVSTIAASWGNAQRFSAPSLYFKQYINNKDENKFLILNKYNADVNIQTEVRKKGIFKVPVYTAEVLLKGDFKNEYGNLSGKKMYFSFDVSDSSGFIEEPVYEINNTQARSADSTTVVVPLNTAASYIPFKISYKIRGLNSIALCVGGLNNKFKVSGNWSNPSFEGNFLPSNRIVERNSFNAEWSIPNIAKSSISEPKVEVSLLVPVDNYRMADRTLKYAFLFLALTFISYFIFEISSKEERKIHPLQYCMLGGALLVFYLLLVSLSEFMPFIIAYIISAAMIIALIATYTYFVITKASGKVFTGLISGLLVFLYILLYILLSLQDFALLLGSFGMFIIIAAMMYLTRNIDWYCSTEE